MIRDFDGKPIPPADVMPSGMCQPPVSAFALIDRLDFAEMRLVIQTMAIWAPEVFEQGLRTLSSERALGRVAPWPRPEGWRVADWVALTWENQEHEHR